MPLPLHSLLQRLSPLLFLSGPSDLAGLSPRLDLLLLPLHSLLRRLLHRLHR